MPRTQLLEIGILCGKETSTNIEKLGLRRHMGVCNRRHQYRSHNRVISVIFIWRDYGFLHRMTCRWHRNDSGAMLCSEGLSRVFFAYQQSGTHFTTLQFFGDYDGRPHWTINAMWPADTADALWRADCPIRTELVCYKVRVTRWQSSLGGRKSMKQRAMLHARIKCVSGLSFELAGRGVHFSLRRRNSA